MRRASLIALTAVLAGDAEADARTVIALQPESSAVSAYRGHVVGDRLAGRRFELMLWHAARGSVSYVLRGRPGTVLRTRGREPAVRPIDPLTFSVQRARRMVFWSAEQEAGPSSERYKIAAEPVG